MTPNNLLTATSLLCFLLPVFVVFYCRLYRHVGIIALVLYCGVKLFQLSDGNEAAMQDFESGSALFCHFLETPLLLCALLAFCRAGRWQERMQALVLFFVVYELIVLLFIGGTPLAGSCVTLLGYFLVVLYSLLFFLQQLRFTLTHQKNSGRLLIISAVLLLNGFYLGLCIAYFFLERKDGLAFNSMYFFVPNLSMLVLGLGLYTMRQRMRNLQELKIVRREMQMLFGS